MKVDTARERGRRKIRQRGGRREEPNVVTNDQSVVVELCCTPSYGEIKDVSST